MCVYNLNEREKQILSLIKHGYTNKKISQSLGISENTIKWYLKTVYQKLDVKSRTEAVVKTIPFL